MPFPDVFGVFLGVETFFVAAFLLGGFLAADLAGAFFGVVFLTVLVGSGVSLLGVSAGDVRLVLAEGADGVETRVP